MAPLQVNNTPQTKTKRNSPITFICNNFFIIGIVGPKSLTSASFVFLHLRFRLYVTILSTKSWHGIVPIFRNRRSRETSILKAIENGAETLFDIVAEVYSEFDRSVWIPAASNVRLHVEHLAEQDKLPKVTFACFNTSISHGYTSTHISLNIHVLVR